METDKTPSGFEKPIVDEDYLMNIMSGDQTIANDQSRPLETEAKETKPREKSRLGPQKKVDYEELFLTNRYPSGRSGKVVYIRPEYHERLLRIVQLTKEEKTTLYSYIDNILEYHFKEFGVDITNYFNNKYKPIL
mgnify:CR=1 FL=1